MRNSALALFISTICGMSSAANAYQTGDVVLRVGLAHVAPNSVSSDTIMNNGSSLNAKVDSISSDTQLGLTGTYMLTDKVGIELLAATPFKHTIKAKGGTLDSLGVSDLGTTKHLPPTISAQYYPMENSSQFQPYVGVGINYTHFFNEKTDGKVNSALGQEYDLELKDSWGLAAQVGIDYQLTDSVSLNAAVWYINIKTEATFTGQDGTKIEAEDVSIDPLVYMAGVSYRF